MKKILLLFLSLLTLLPLRAEQITFYNKVNIPSPASNLTKTFYSSTYISTPLEGFPKHTTYNSGGFSPLTSNTSLSSSTAYVLKYYIGDSNNKYLDQIAAYGCTNTNMNTAIKGLYQSANTNPTLGLVKGTYVTFRAKYGKIKRVTITASGCNYATITTADCVNCTVGGTTSTIYVYPTDPDKPFCFRYNTAALLMSNIVIDYEAPETTVEPVKPTLKGNIVKVATPVSRWWYDESTNTIVSTCNPNAVTSGGDQAVTIAPSNRETVYYTFSEDESLSRPAIVSQAINGIIYKFGASSPTFNTATAGSGKTQMSNWIKGTTPVFPGVPESNLGKEYTMRVLLYDGFNGYSDEYKVKFKIIPIDPPTVNFEKSKDYGIKNVETEDDGTIVVSYDSDSPKLFLNMGAAKNIYYTTNRANPTTSSTMYNETNGIVPFAYVAGDAPLPIGTTTFIKAMTYSANKGITATYAGSGYTGGPVAYTGGTASIKLVRVGAQPPVAPEVAEYTIDDQKGTETPSMYRFDTSMSLSFMADKGYVGKVVFAEPTADVLASLTADDELPTVVSGDYRIYTINRETLNGNAEAWLIVAGKNDAGLSKPIVVHFGLKGPAAPQIVTVKDKDDVSKPFRTTRFILNNGEYTIADGETFNAGFFSPTNVFEYQMVVARDGNWPETPAKDGWQSGKGTGSYWTVNGIDVYDTGRFFYRAGTRLDASDPESAVVYGDYAYIDIQRLNPQRISSISTWQGNKAGDLVIINEKLRVMGYYTTNAPGAPFYVYLMNAEGAVIKVVASNPGNTTTDNTPEDVYYAVTVNNTLHNTGALWQPAVAAPEQQLVLPAGSIVGRIQFVGDDENMPEIRLANGDEDLLPLMGLPVEENSSDAGAFALSAAGKAKQYPTSAKTTVSDTNDFNRYVELRSLTWLGANNEVRMTNNDVLPVYGSRLVVPDYTFYNSGLETGKMYSIKGFVGQAGGRLAIFPIEEVKQCPGTPNLYAPNPIGAPEADGYVHAQAISDRIEFTVVGNADGQSTFVWSLDNGAMQDVVDGKFTVDLSEKEDGNVVEIAVYGNLNGMLSLVPARVKITKKAATKIGSIYDYKKAMFESLSENLYQLDPASKVLIEEITPKYLYVRDYNPDAPAAAADDAEGYLRRLLIHNENGWSALVDKNGTQEELKVGDIITGFALKAAKKNGNLFSESTGFARTFKYAGSDKQYAGKAEDREVSSLNGTTFKFTDTDRMRLLTLKDVTVGKSGSEPYVYTLNLAPGSDAELRFDIFTFRGGWAEAWAEGVPFDITGVVLMAGEDGSKFSFAPIDFAGKSKLEVPSVYLSTIDESKRGDLEQPYTSGSIIMEAAANAPAGTTIHYSIDGLDPLHNLDSRLKYNANGENPELELGNTTIEVRAFAAAPGYTPSDVVVRRFTKSSHDVQFILNFLNTAKEGESYRFTGNTRVVAKGGDYLFVAGTAGHYLPIYREGGWESDGLEAIKEGNMLTGFTVGYKVDENGNRMATADGFENSFNATAGTADDFRPVPDETYSLDFTKHPRRLVRLMNVKVNAAPATLAEGDTETEWTVTESGDNGVHALLPGKLGNVVIRERDSEGNVISESSEFADGESYNIIGFVMLTSAKAAEMEMWPLQATHLRRTGEVKASFSEGTTVAEERGLAGEVKATFEGTTTVTLSCDTRYAKIYYAFGEDATNLVWYEYQHPFVMTASQFIHAKALAPNCVESDHTDIILTRKDQAGAVTITADNSTPGAATVTMTAAEQGTITYWTSKESTRKTYRGAFEVSETTVVYAQLTVEGKIAGQVSHLFVEVLPVVSEPETPAEKMSGRLMFSTDSESTPGHVLVTIEPEAELAPGSYEIYYTTEGGQLTKDNGTLYEGPIDVTETTMLQAILIESGKEAGEVCYHNVWVNPGVTGIEGIEGTEGEGIRVEGNSIVAPEGSEVYDLNGRRVNPNGLANGIYIVRTADGKATKVRI